MSSADRPTRAVPLGLLIDASSVVTLAHSTLEIGLKKRNREEESLNQVSTRLPWLDVRYMNSPRRMVVTCELRHLRLQRQDLRLCEEPSQWVDEAGLKDGTGSCHGSTRRGPASLWTQQLLTEAPALLILFFHIH